VLSGLIILFMIFDSVIKLPPLDIVTQTMVPLGWPADPMCGARSHYRPDLDRALRAASDLVLGAILLTGYMGGAIATNMRVGSPLFSHTLFAVYLGINPVEGPVFA